jgi:hypothetical protein
MIYSPTKIGFRLLCDCWPSINPLPISGASFVNLLISLSVKPRVRERSPLYELSLDSSGLPVKAVVERTDGVRLQVDYGNDETALVGLWRAHAADREK